jgi:hypothetical protein
MNIFGSPIVGNRITSFLYDQDYELIVIFHVFLFEDLSYKIKVIDLEAEII